MRRKNMRWKVRMDARYWRLYGMIFASNDAKAWKAEESFIRLHDCNRDFKKTKTKYHNLGRRKGPRVVLSMDWPATLTRPQRRRFMTVWYKHQAS